jgi:hypothetical protein
MGSIERGETLFPLKPLCIITMGASVGISFVGRREGVVVMRKTSTLNVQ